MCLESREGNYKGRFPPIFNSTILVFCNTHFIRKKGEGLLCFKKLKTESQWSILGLGFKWGKSFSFSHVAKYSSVGEVSDRRTGPKTKKQSDSFKIILCMLSQKQVTKHWLLVDFGFQDLCPIFLSFGDIPFYLPHFPYPKRIQITY